MTGANNNAKFDRMWKKTKDNCERYNCSNTYTFAEEAYNCVNECTSSSCYADVYASSPLEDGEIDVARSRVFSACLRKEIKANMVRVHFTIYMLFYTFLTLRFV